MYKRIKIVLCACLCLAFLAALGPMPYAQAAPPKPPQMQEYLSENGEIVTIKASDATAMRSAPFTQELRMNSKPMSLVVVKNSDLGSLVGNSAGGESGSKAGALPDPAAVAQMKAQYPEAWGRTAPDMSALQGTSSTDMFGTKNTWTGYLGNYFDPFWTQYPYSTVGQLYFTDGVYNYSCSASLINYNLIVTAAHCVFNTDYDYWYYNWTFVPADYNHGSYMPYGYYNWSAATILTKWGKAKKSSKGLKYDVALIQLYGSPGSATGYLGYAWNWKPKQMQHAIGYPSNIYGGISSYICAAESFSKKGGLGMGCDMTFGSSGGPWILWFIPYQGYYPYTVYGNYVDAVVSGGTPGTPTFYGPKFTDKNIGALCYLTGWC
jgi:hypothetical protein